MGEKIKAWLKKPWFIYTFGFYFLVYKSTQYFQFFQALTFLLFFALYCAVNFLIILLLKRLGLYKYGLGPLLIVWILLFFFTPAVYFLRDNAPFVQIRYFAAAALVIFFLLRSLTKIAIGSTAIRALNQFLNVFILLLTVSAVVNGFFTYQHEQWHKHTLTNKKVPALNSKRDIVWILLDEYASPASLRSQFQFHDPLVDSLKSRGFFVYDALHSRSDATISSVSSLFNMDDSIPVSNFMYAAAYLRNNVWSEALKNNGYSFTSYDFMDIYDSKKVAHLNFFPDTYIDQLFYGTEFSILWDKYIKRDGMAVDNYNQQVITALNRRVTGKWSSPQFIWAHLLIPHPAFYRDAAGKLNRNIIEVPESAPPFEVKKQYTRYLLYGNAIMMNILNHIPAWQNKIIVITGDHGARMLIPATDERRKMPFAAIYYPGMDTNKVNKIKYLQQIPFQLH